MALNRIEETTTIEDLILAGNSVSIKYPTLSFMDFMSNGTQISVFNVVNDYIKELSSACVEVELTKEQQNTYFYKPKLLCRDVYGNPELYFIILLINDMADVKEFTKPKIKMLKKGYMSQLVSDIYNSEKAAIDSYNNKQVQ